MRQATPESYVPGPIEETVDLVDDSAIDLASPFISREKVSAPSH